MVDECPYTCMRCGNKSGLSFIEPKHNCNKPMFDKEGNRINYDAISEEVEDE